MLSSIPAALQAILWPLVGALLVVALNRLLPNWLNRLLAVTASMACLVSLGSLVGQAPVGFQTTWEPFTFLRTSPALQPTPLGLVIAIILAAWNTLAALGIRGSQYPKATWYGLGLVLLAGGVLMALAANLLTLVLGSALLDLALLCMAVSAVGGAGQGQRVSFRLCLPGLASTGVLILAALRMDTGTGTLSLSAQEVSPQVLALLAVAGILRLGIFPLQPRGLGTPEQAAAQVLSMGAGNLLLARAVSLGEAPAATLWFLAIGVVALLAGGWLAWNAGSARAVPGRWPEMWSAFAVQQAGAAVVFAFLFPGAAPWPVASLALVLGLLILWWDATQAGSPGSASALVDRVRRQATLLGIRLHAWASRLPGRRAGSAPRGEPSGLPTAESPAEPEGGSALWKRLRDSWLSRRGADLLPAVALASLAGMPLTAGAVLRWHLYVALLTGANPLLLVGLLVSDAFLAGGLILAWRGIARADTPARRWPAVGAMGLLGVCSIVLWFAPRLWAHAGMPALPGSGVSAWGVGMLFALPWLLGAWLAKVAGSAEGYLKRLRQAASLDRVAWPVGWLGQKLLTAIYWLGSVGEGEGWWGWALAVLALGALYLAGR